MTYSGETVLLPYRAGRETRGTFLANLAKHVSRREGMRDGSKDEKKSAAQSGPTESAMLTAPGETHHSLASKTERLTILSRAVPHIHHQHRM